jgi:hypothetical protein
MMPTDPSLTALRESSPRNRPDFDELLAGCEELATQITATPRSSSEPAPRRPARRRRWIGVAALTAGAALAAIAAGVTLGGASPQNAYAAAHNALAATSAQRSGTKTLTVNGTRLYTLRWNGDRVALAKGESSPLVLGHVLGDDRQLRLIGSAVYVQGRDGTWSHYARSCMTSPTSCPSAAGVAYKLGPEVINLAAQVKGDTAHEILSVATDLHRSGGPDGTIVYTGTIRNVHADPLQTLSEDDIMGIIAKLRGGGASDAVAPGGTYPATSRLRLVVGRDGLVQRISFSFQQPSCPTGAPAPNCPQNGPPTSPDRTITWTVQYSHLGDNQAITAQ